MKTVGASGGEMTFLPDGSLKGQVKQDNGSIGVTGTWQIRGGNLEFHAEDRSRYHRRGNAQDGPTDADQRTTRALSRSRAQGDLHVGLYRGQFPPTPPR